MPSLKRLAGDDAKCTGCGQCMTACSTLFFKEDDPSRSCISIHDVGEGHHIVVCDQRCRLCVAECSVQALSVNSKGVVLLDRKLCIGCLACVAACPIGAMRYVPGLKNPFKCIACGACAKECPTGAIAVVTEEI
jgi:anaerobic carbon-monoxide dehydrogenase iron sulfur subunit